jgi:hypothetical protein
MLSRYNQNLMGDLFTRHANEFVVERVPYILTIAVAGYRVPDDCGFGCTQEESEKAFR